MPTIVDRITKLPEYEKAEIRIDSLNKVGVKVKIQISISSNSFYPEDSLKNIALALIEENYGFDQTILYEIRFDKATHAIISVKPSSIK